MPAGRYTVPAVLDRRAEQFGDRVMMSIAGTPVTFAQMRDRSCAAANVLAELGVQRGETVALFTGTCPEWVYFWLGAARIGAITAAVNGASKGDFLLHALRLSQGGRGHHRQGTSSAARRCRRRCPHAEIHSRPR